MKKKTIALLSGGASSEREVSLSSGNQVYEALDREKYDIIRYDPKTDLLKLVTDAPGIDAALIILHGPFGEDGTVQGLLDLLGIPYQGSGVLGSALAMNKHAAKIIYEQAGIPAPRYEILNSGDQGIPDKIEDRLGFPIVVKPVEAGSSVGMSIVDSKAALPDAVRVAFEFDDTVMLEQFINGTEITCSVMGNQNPKALPVIEIIPAQGHAFFDYKAKYEIGGATEICPARIDDAIAEKAKAYAIKAHEALFCKGCSRTDMIISDNDVYVLETNTIPGMTPTSLLPQSAAAAGMSFSEMLDRLIDMGIEAKRH